MPKVATLHITHPLDCMFAQLVRAEHADLCWYIDRGYIHYRDDKARLWLPYEHQLVARLAHGLPDGYHVHHIDGDPLNNRADNLLPLSPSEHSRIHNGQAVYGTFTCAHCGSTFRRKLNLVRAATLYCGPICQGIASRRTERPDADTLFDLMFSVGNWCALGRMFGVSDNAVRKWAKRYELDLSVCDGRLR